METMAATASPAQSLSREHDAVGESPQLRRWPDPHTIREAWTVADLESLPDDGLRYEILDGLLLVSPAPIPLHQIVVGEIYALLRASCPAAMRVLMAPVDWRPDETTSVEPDILVMRRSDVMPQRLAGTPLVVVEVLSRSSRSVDRTLKFERYQRAGIGQYWIVDPGGASFGKRDRPPSIEVFDLADGRYTLQMRAVGDETVTVSSPLLVTVAAAALIA
jgi:Uma2 family endonuclease